MSNLSLQNSYFSASAAGPPRRRSRKRVVPCKPALHRRRKSRWKRTRTASCSAAANRNADRPCRPIGWTAPAVRCLARTSHNETRKSAWREDRRSGVVDQVGEERNFGSLTSPPPLQLMVLPPGDALPANRQPRSSLSLELPDLPPALGKVRPPDLVHRLVPRCQPKNAKNAKRFWSIVFA